MCRPGATGFAVVHALYADLRPAPATAPVVQPAGGGFDPLTAPLALLEREPGEAAGTTRATAAADPAQVGDGRAAGKHAAPTTEPDLTWPCATCGAMVPFDETSCSACGAGFLENVDADTSLHRFGLHTGLVSKQTKAVIMIGGSFGLLVLLLGIMYLLGTLL